MNYKTIIKSIVFSLFLVSGALMSQDMNSATEKELTKDQWQQEMKQASARRDMLRHEVDSLDAAIASLRSQDSLLAVRIQNGENELATALDRMKSQREALEQQLNDIDSRLNDLAALKQETLPDHESEINGIASSIADAKSNRLSRMQEYKDRIANEEQRLSKLQTLLAELKTEGRTVVVGTWAENRACLWNIAKKSSVYDNPALWVKIWQANTGKISNPDIIQPGQRLRVPAKSPLTRREQNALHEYTSTKEETRPMASRTEQR